MDQPTDKIIRWAPVVVAAGLLINFALAGHIYISLFLFAGWLLPFLYTKGVSRKTLKPIIVLAILLLLFVFFQGGIPITKACSTVVDSSEQEALETKINGLIGSNDQEELALLVKQFKPGLNMQRNAAGLSFSKEIGPWLNDVITNPRSQEIDIQKIEYDCQNKYYKLFWYTYR